MEARVSEVLKQKGYRVVTVAPQETVAAVVQVLTKNRIGAAPVINKDGRLVGIVSERDIIRGISEHADALLTFPVEKLMTRDVHICSPFDRLVVLMQAMTLRRIHHLPGVENGKDCGIVIIRDRVKRRPQE